MFIFYVVAGYVYFVNNGSLVFCWFLNKIFLIKKKFDISIDFIHLEYNLQYKIIEEPVYILKNTSKAT